MKTTDYGKTPRLLPPRKPAAPEVRRAVLDIGKWISLELTAEKYGFTIDDKPCGNSRTPNKPASGKGREK